MPAALVFRLPYAVLEVVGSDRADIEIVNSNAGVELVRVAGTASVSASNGGILAEFARLDVGATTSLITSNGVIVVTLPGSFEGRVLAESDTGPIESDFSVTPEPAVGLARPGHVLSGRIGAGGPLLRLRTENAGIKLVRAGED